jgi:predicted nucleotidyltransferase
MFEEMHKNALKLVQEQVKRHSLGKLFFLAFIGTRPWGIAQENVDFDYRGVYMPKRRSDSIVGVYINNHAKDITMVSFGDFVGRISSSSIHPLICINSPIIYASKEFLKFKKWVNSHLSKEVCEGCRTKPYGHTNRKDYLYDFFFIGNGIAILEQKKVIANLPELNKKILRIPAMNKIIEEEKAGLPFKTKRICKKVLNQLKTRLEIANKKSRLPEEIKKNKFIKYA